MSKDQNDASCSMATYALFTEIALPDRARTMVSIGTAQRNSERCDEWLFKFEQLPLSGKVWAKVM